MTRAPKKGLFLAHSVKIQFIVVGKAQQRELAPILRGRRACWCSVHFLLYIQAAFPAQGMVLPIVDTSSHLH